MATKKKKKSKTKKPTDLQITRKNSKFTFKWKTGEKYEGQRLWYRVKGPNGWFNWIPRNLPAKTTSLTIELPLNQIAPDGMKIHAVQFKAQGWAKDKPDSEWNSCTYTLKKPNKPSLSMSILSQESASFTFSVVADKTKPEAFERTEYMTALSGGTATPTWSAPVNGGASGTLTYRENSTQVASGSHTRWFRVRARGYRGDTEWVTSKRVYAKPRPANIIKTSYTQDGSGVHGWFQWNSSYDTAYPIDSTSAEYVEVVPDANVSLPAGELQWKSAGGLSGARATDSVSFDIDHAIDDDKVVFVRVNTTHENWTTNSVPKILVKGNLAAPDAPVLSDQDPEQYTVTVTADNNSEVADSFLVVSYKSDTQPQIDIGIIPHGQSSVNVRCPAWGSENKSFGVRAVVGTYTQTVRADNVRIYTVSASMTSKGIRWTDGNLPVAPGNVTVTVTDVVGSVRVGWKWSWSKADSAEITWSDHEDAWESTDEPESYIVSNLHASQWNIAGLELGKTWHVRVRLIDGSGEDDVKGPWSPIEHIDLASAPAIPILTLSSEKELNGQKMSVITMDDILTAYWSYITTDGSGQAYAEICEAEIVDGTIEYGRVIAKTESAQHIDIDPKDPLIGWSAGDTKLLCVRVASGSGKSSPGWSAPVSVSVADPITAQITETSLVDEEIVENPQTYTGDIVSFESENVAPEAKSLTVSLSPIQSLNGYDHPWVGGAGKNLFWVQEGSDWSGISCTLNSKGAYVLNGTTASGTAAFIRSTAVTLKAGTYRLWGKADNNPQNRLLVRIRNAMTLTLMTTVTPDNGTGANVSIAEDTSVIFEITVLESASLTNTVVYPQLEVGTTKTEWEPYSNICPISGRTEVVTQRTGKNLLNSTAPTIVDLTGQGVNRYAQIFEASGTYTIVNSSSSDTDIYYRTPTKDLSNRGTSVNIPTNGSRTVSVDDNHVLWVFRSANTDMSPFAVNRGTDTAYEPYQGTTYRTEIEGNYSVTSTDNEPYLLKTVEDIDGDRLRESIVGGTVAWNQQLYGGDFSIANAWVGLTGGVLNISNNECSIEINANFGGMQTRVNDIGTDKCPTLISGHKYLMSADIKASNNRTNSVGFGISKYDSANQVRKMFSVGTSYVKCAFIGTSNTTTPQADVRFMLFDTSGGTTSVTLTAKNMMCVDLTQMFGSTIADYIYSLEQSTAGAGVAWFKKLFPNDYYAYDAGTLKSVQTSGHKVVGFDQWDEEWELGSLNGTGGNANSSTEIRSKNYIPVLSNTAYYLYCAIASTFNYRFYDADKNFISGGYISRNSLLTAPNNARYMRFYMGSAYGTTYNNDICINISSSRNGEYEPYKSTTYPLDADLVLRGIPKLNNGQLYYDGDEYKSDGSVSRKYGVVDLGTLNWTLHSAGFMQSNGIASLVKKPSTSSDVANVVCSTLEKVSAYSIYNNGNGVGIHSDGSIRARYGNMPTDPTAFKTAMNGVMLVYELAESTTESATPFESIQKITNGGTMQYLTDGIVPVGHETEYLSRATYGGVLNVLTGELVIDMAMDSIDGTTSLDPNGTYVGMGTEWVYTPTKAKKFGINNMLSDRFARGGAGKFGSIYGRANNGKIYLCLPETANTPALMHQWFTDNPTQVVYELANPQTVQLSPQEVSLLIGENNVWSDGGSVTLMTADAIRQAKALKNLPLTITVTGAGNGGTTTVAIERFGARSTDNRPDERTYDGFDGETVALIDQTGEAQISIDRNSDELFGVLDDGAWYRIVATAEDALGQTSTATQEFIVDWTHQAVVPDADIEVLEQNVVKIKPKLPAELPDGWTFDEGDSCDIYRLTADLPELIVEGAQFGTEYVDPYPAIGEFGGHRLVYRTAEGDYTTPDNSIAWYDTGEDEGDTIESDAVLIDFNGTQIALRYNLDLSNSWEKDFRETRYLGGSIQGDWNEGVSRSSSVSAITVSFTDPDTIRLMRRLAEYAGVCHVRTLDGSSFPCDIQVSENREQDGYNKLVRFSLSITRVDAEEYEGMTYADWREQNGLE